MDGNTGREFEQAATEANGRTIVAEFRDFLRHNKKWWLLPLVLVLLLQALLLMLASTAAGPFIYPLF